MEQRVESRRFHDDLIELTPEQRAKIRSATGKDAAAVELSVEDLEKRIAPGTLRPPGKP
jgi:hypothetical protein